ncbi:MAG: efflux RND transporter periplasmic adaptor subunit [Bryobacterales bacterium]|nr:efflux RND transporter periplasmic adaptor subunit [Bryobacterales bacterium]
MQAKIVLIGLVGVVVLFAAACSRATPAGQAPAPPVVVLTRVEQKDVPIAAEWIGTLDGMVNAVIRAQVTGYLLRQEYKEGSVVGKGQLLFEIDPRPFHAALSQAQGQLAQAKGQLAQAKAQLIQSEAQLAKSEADQIRTQRDSDRYIALADAQAVTQQDIDNAVQNNVSAKALVKAAAAQVETSKAQIQAAGASVEAAAAAVETATVNLGFTRLTAPINGVAGLAQMQVGNLVGPGNGPITTVSTLDPIKVYFTVSEQEYLGFARFSDGGGFEAAMRALQLELILADGTVYRRKGRFFFANREVDPKTGAIQLAGLFPNPGNVLRPGQFARIRSVVRMQKDALLVPQRAVMEMQGGYQVAVVDGANRVSLRAVKPGARYGAQWIIDDGLKPNERVVVEGADKVRPGIQVSPKGT